MRTALDRVRMRRGFEFTRENHRARYACADARACWMRARGLDELDCHRCEAASDMRLGRGGSSSSALDSNGKRDVISLCGLFSRNLIPKSESHAWSFLLFVQIV